MPTTPMAEKQIGSNSHNNMMPPDCLLSKLWLSTWYRRTDTLNHVRELRNTQEKGVDKKE